MAVDAGTYEIGSEHGTVRLFTARQGVAAAVGHDLEIEFTRWSGTVEIGAGGGTSSVAVAVDLDSLTVVTGTGGVKPLTDSDRGDIRKNALKVLAADRHPAAGFRSEKVAVDEAGSGEIFGTLSLAGASAPLRLEVSGSGPRAWRASGEIAQTALGIKPYKAFLGALRLADVVRIEVDLNLDGHIR